MKFVLLIGRILYASFFVAAYFLDMTSDEEVRAIHLGTIELAILTPVASVALLLGGISVAFGIRPKAGAWLLILFLFPISFYMHPFWKFDDNDPLWRTNIISCLKDLSMVGAALILTYFGTGPLSVTSTRLSGQQPEPGFTK
ncbi:MAG: DoxX family protein [Chitinophagaceae bacterium]